MGFNWGSTGVFLLLRISASYSAPIDIHRRADCNVRFSDDISFCLQILNLEFANAICALVCLPVLSRTP